MAIYKLKESICRAEATFISIFDVFVIDAYKRGFKRNKTIYYATHAA